MGFDRANQVPAFSARFLSGLSDFLLFQDGQTPGGRQKKFPTFQHVFSGKESAVDLAQLSNNALSAFGDKPSHRQMEGPPEKASTAM